MKELSLKASLIINLSQRSIVVTIVLLLQVTTSLLMADVSYVTTSKLNID